MKEIDSLNYVKLDLLKLDTIELIADTCKLANIPMITPDNIDITDVKVWDSMRDDTTQIFQWEGDTGDTYIKKLLSDKNIQKFQKIDKNVDRMTLLSIGNSAIRPAGASYREDLANGVVRKSGSKAIDDFLKPTFGYLVFQCQIIEFLHNYCGFTMGEADVVRRHFAKKYGTDKDIPIIKDGGYLTEDSKHHIDGFVVTMKNKYDMSKEEAEKTIADFLIVIEDASRYLFSLNHSQPYSYEAYVEGWLRYYYPLEFLTISLNINQDKEEKTKALIRYAKKNNIEIKNPKYGKSKDNYFCDKESNSIYKGIGSIKFMNGNVANELYKLSKNNINNFIELLNRINSDTSLNSKQLDILVKLNFFSEFGDINQLLSMIDIFNNYGSCKQIKKNTLSKEILEAIEPLCAKNTEKTLKEFDNDKIMNVIYSLTPISPSTPLDSIRYELELLGYTDITIPDSPYYAVESIEVNQYGTPFITLYQISNGISFQYKCDKKYFNSYKCEQGDILDVVIRTKPKKKLIGQDENGKNIWEDGELEDVIKVYDIIQ